MASMNYTSATLQKWVDKMSRDIADRENIKVAPFFGTGNEKTHAVNEGTLPLVTCHQSAICHGGCGHSCYGLRLIFRNYAAYDHYLNNTILRRRDPKAYYSKAFAAAFAAGTILRLNENGDFENAAQFRAACTAARLYKSVKCLTYTHRREIAKLAKTAPKNLLVRYSAWTSEENVKWAKHHGIPYAAVSKFPASVKGCTLCPSQMRRMANEEAFREGLEPLPEWTCAACIAASCGCASAKNIVFKMH